MIKVRLNGDFYFTNSDLVEKNYAKAIMTDCWMTIEIGDERCFDDWVCPLELYFQYLDWKKDYLKGNIHDFNYISDDNAENPILSFKFSDDNWEIFSCLYKTNQKIETIDVLGFFDSFETQLLKHKKQ